MDLTDAALRDVEAAKQEVYRLCKDGHWRMTVPVSESEDSDRIIMRGLNAFLALRDAARAEQRKRDATFIEQVANELDTLAAANIANDLVHGMLTDNSCAVRNIAAALLAQP